MEDFKDTSIIFKSISLLNSFSIDIKNLPKIIVLGEQNQGKSSLIEAITQVSLLPKCEGLCTKKPIEITLIRNNLKKFLVNDQEFSEEEAINQISKLNQNNSVKKINCTILSPDVLNCNIVDTIGLIKVSEEDERLDPKKIKENIIEYLKDKNNVFVLVSSATNDLANSQMYQLIKKYDRLNDTLGVMTKIDLTENQNMKNIDNILSDKIYRVGYGWIVTKLRSDRDIENSISIDQSIINEENYFNQRPFNSYGIYNIRKTLSFIQFNRIKPNIPIIISEIEQKILSLKGSQTFIQKVINDKEGDLSGKLVNMIERLVGSSYERSEFENSLKTKLCEFLLNYMNEIFGYDESNELPELKKSSEYIPSYIYDHHSSIQLNAKNYVENEIHEMLNTGLISPIAFDNISLKQSYEKESTLATFMSFFEFELDDPMNKKKIAWVKYLEKFFSALQNGAVLQNKVYEITESMMIEYINQNNEDELSKKFTEYMIKEIGQKAFEEKMKYSINVLINIEQRPDVNLFEIVKQILTITKSNYFDYSQFYSITKWVSKPNCNKIKIELYSDIWNRAYLTAVTKKISFNCYRVVTVNLVNKMVDNLLNMIIGLDKESSQKENDLIQQKIELLKETKNNFEIFLD